MSSVSNKYASKIFSEHPIAMWPLDEDAYYVSAITNEERNILDNTKWDLINCSTSSSTPEQSSPFLGTADYFEINGNATVLGPSGGTIELLSKFSISKSNLNSTIETIALNFYLYQNNSRTLSYEYGIEYYSSALSQNVRILQSGPGYSNSTWIRFQNSFKLSEIDANTFKIVIKINVDGGGSAGEYGFILNALSLGQQSELFSAKSLGGVETSLPSSINLPGTIKAIQADQYGPITDNAYYIIENNSLLSVNNGLPMVYGSENSTSIYPSSNSYPSLIFPSKGFLSKEGQNKTYTVEFWMRIRPNTKLDRKIFGPLNSNDGLYVSEGFLTLSIGNQFQSYNVSEWYRPMLIHILYSNTNANVFINGEEVINIVLNDVFNFLENEWIAFYSYEDIYLFEIDCISIFSYSVPLQVAKRRFVWGQGVGSQETIDSSFSGFPTAISFPNAGYSSNIIYPDKERWNAGFYNNLVSTTTSLSVPQHTLPEIFLSGRNLESWYQANKSYNDIAYPPPTTHPKFITFRPNLSEESWNWTEKCYLKFSAENIASKAITAIYGVFEIEEEINYDRPLIHILNTLTNKKFEINIKNYEITYSFDGTELYSQDISGEQHVIVGLHIPTVSNHYDLSTFFSPYDALKFFVGGSPDNELNAYETFEGKIYKIAFADTTNYEEIKNHFGNNPEQSNYGFAQYDDDSFFTSHYSTYAVSPFYRYGRFFLDISISASWEQYYPLSYFAKYVYDNSGSLAYLLDFLQFNIGYPSYTVETIQTTQGLAWDHYSLLETFFSIPVQKSYLSIENYPVSPYASYEDLENNTISTVIIDESQSSVNIFATFQLISEGANEPIENFTYTKELDDSFVVDASLENTQIDPYKAYKTKFRIIDNTIIYPPKNIKMEQLALVLYFSINQDGVLSRPLKIKDMEISSKSLNVSQPNPVGTKFNNNIYPYIKSNIYYDYKSKNPILINKRNTPYLHFTENSGIKVLTNNQSDKEYAVAIPINNNMKNDFSVSAIQLFIKYDSNITPGVYFPLFEVQSKNIIIQFLGVYSQSDNRYKIIAKNKNTGQDYTSLTFYQNGINVINPYLIKNQWAALSVLFDINDPLDFSGFTGSIDIFSSCHFDNISYYQSKGLIEIFSINPRIWDDVRENELGQPLDWQYWYDEYNNPIGKNEWQDIYIINQQKEALLGPPYIYSTYIGTNISTVDDGTGINLLDDDFIIFSELSWTDIVEKPA